MKLSPQENEHQSPTWTLIRDVGVLQVKLIIDGLRDLILVPASLIAGFISLLKRSKGQPGDEFYRLVSVGKQSEEWINLFGALRNAPPDLINEINFGDNDMDSIISRAEDFIVDEYKRGGVTAQAKERIDKALQAMRRRGQKNDSDPGN
jgi:hypothetical protein